MPTLTPIEDVMCETTSKKNHFTIAPSDCAWKIQFKSDEADRKFEDLLSKATHTRDAIEACQKASAGAFVHQQLGKTQDEVALKLGRLLIDAQTFPCKRD